MFARAVRTLGRPPSRSVQPRWPQDGLAEKTTQTTATVAPPCSCSELQTMLPLGERKPHQCTSAASRAPAGAGSSRNSARAVATRGIDRLNDDPLRRADRVQRQLERLR